MATDDQIKAARDAFIRASADYWETAVIWDAVIDAADDAAWSTIASAPTDGTYVLVYAAPIGDLPGFVYPTMYYEDAGWRVDEPRGVTHWRPLPVAPRR